MKALACLVACLLFTVPAHAFGHGGGPHGGGPRPGHGHHHGRNDLGQWGGDGGYEAVPDIAEPAVEAPVAQPLPAAPYCPPPPRPNPGPHIIYIGHRPVIHGPQVIYGTD
jgi:hypothetical protein